MAAGTITYLPTAQISCNHALSSGTTSYVLIQQNDGDTTYIYSESGTSSANDVSSSSSFTCTNSSSINSNIIITAVRIYCIVRKTESTNASFSCNVGIGNTQGTSDTGINSSNLTTSYQSFSNTSNLLLTQLNNYITQNLTLPNLRIDLTTTSKRRGQGLSKYSNEVRVTQIYIELDYETTETSKIYLKENNAWKEYSKVYIKENNNWVEKSMDQISSIFSTTANYVKSS